ncbi:IniB N-terminal domain-containing protein [Lentzea sp. NBC_00516]|uniref:IniB N-terminal domain-containing protein n=1 Tax=Lentzea sp. NBC_00516 TaxID=2903582 RepID=UPI002E7FEF03|nr:IniB N-terminal domain-containing protein [Lentzea sp. NBC_00516]WUD22168.1 IniB N-terminal domain-containing protein [Lentzea sp. NBC_00516]
MTQPSTLHDFVLNLLSDPSLKDAFAADAQGTLEQAGLADITAVDVQEVIPLVIDLLPATPAGLPAIDGVDLALPTDTLLADGPLGAISQLQAVASQLTSSGVSLSDLHTSSAGVLAADENGFNLIAANKTLGQYTSTNIGLDGDFSAVGDVTSVLDQTASPLTGTVLDVADTATATVDAPLDGVTSAVPGVDGVLGHLGGVTGLAHDALGVLGGSGADLGVLNVSGLGDLADGNLTAHSTETVITAEHTAAGVVDTATSLTGTATGLVGDHGVGNVLGTVTDVTHNVPVVGDLDLGLLG